MHSADAIHMLIPADGIADPEVTILVPALNEELTIGGFVAWCREGIAFGRAYIDAIPHIRGRFVIMGDADCTYDFREIRPFIEAFRTGAEFVMGSRLKGSIEPGAMPPLHRYFGTPVTTFILNLMFGSRFSDIHCGMRGITRDALTRMDLRSQGWEYASEMVLKSVHMRLRTTEVPIHFLKDPEGRLSHMKRRGWLEPWRAGWMNLRAMLIHGVDFFLIKPGDLAQFYRRKRGAVLSCAIMKYAFVVVHPYFNAAKYHLKYARTELVDRIDEVQHPLVREALRMMKIEPGIEVVSIADIPSGTGLGSSSSFSVALLNALYAHQRVFAPKEQLALEACILEIERLGEPMGKQDQYAAAYGGVNLHEFEPHGGMTVQPLLLPTAITAELESNLLLFFTGSQRDARSVLAHQIDAVEQDAATFGRLERLVALAYDMRDLLLAGDLDGFGRALDRGWQIKRSISSMISNATIDRLYEHARAAGALGGKVAGAGGGGFLLLYCPKSKQARVREALCDLQSLDFRLDWGGARIAFAQ